MDEKPAKCMNSGEIIPTKYFLFISAIMYGFALQISSRAQPQYIYHYLKEQYGDNTTNNQTNNSCNKASNEDIFQQEASDWAWYFQISEYGISIPVIMLVGPLADKYGRKPILLFNGVLVFISYACRTTVVFFNMNLYYFLVANLINGFSGTFYTYNLLNYAVMSDITTGTKERSFTMVVFDSMLGLAVTCSQIITGYLIQLTSFTYPYLITTLVLLGYVIYVYILFQERWTRNTQKDGLSFSSLVLQTFSLFSKSERRKPTFKHFFLLLIVFLLYYFPFDSFNIIRTLYALGPPFCWSPEHIGWYGAAEDVELFFIAAFILKIAHICTNDSNMACLGLISAFACFTLFGITNTDWAIYEATAAGIVRILPIPLLKSLMSKIVPPDQQGVLFSNISVITSACAVGGSTVFNNIYHKTRPIYKGMVFFIMAVFQLIGGVLMIITICLKSPETKRELTENETEVQTTEK